jgi:hypothetical protein
MNTVKIIELIYTDIASKGSGMPGDPFRRVEQYWTKDGRLLFELDPHKEEKNKIKFAEDVYE